MLGDLPGYYVQGFPGLHPMMLKDLLGYTQQCWGDWCQGLDWGLFPAKFIPDSCIIFFSLTDCYFFSH